MLVKVHVCAVCRTDLLREAAVIPIKSRTVRFPLLQANQALQALTAGSFQGLAVLMI